MDCQSADVATGEERRPDYEGIGRKRDPHGLVPIADRTAQRECRLVFQGRWRVGTVTFHEHALDQIGGQRSTAAVA